MIAFIDGHRAVYGVEPICKVLPIAPSTYHVHAARRANPGKQPARTRSDAALMIDVRRMFETNFCVFGVRKVWRQLGRERIEVARCTVARLMRTMGEAGQGPRPAQQDGVDGGGLRGVVRGRTIRTTVPDPAAPCPLDRVNRQFKAKKPNTMWAEPARGSAWRHPVELQAEGSDITYVAT